MPWFQKKQTVNLESLRGEFEAQSKRLVDLQYHEVLGTTQEDFQCQLNELWNAVEKTAPAVRFSTKGNISLLIVVPLVKPLLALKKMTAHTEVDIMHLHVQHAPEMNVYAVLDAEDGEDQVAISPKDSLKKFEKQERNPLNLAQSVALLTHFPAVLKNHYVSILGARYKKDDTFLPLLWLLDESDNPVLHYAWFDIAHGNYGAASYAVKIEQ